MICKLRGLVALIFIVVAAIGLALRIATGSYSSFGINQIAAICPVGALEALITGKVISWHLFVGLGLTIVFILVFGKAFCAWMCPMPWLRILFTKRRKIDTFDPIDNAQANGVQTLKPVGEKRDGLNVKGGHVILLGTLISTAVFGFPVFCLVCPIGLTFATLVALWHLFQFAEATGGLVVFPLIIIVEVLFLKKWCRNLCPLGALMSLLSKGNKTLRPQVQKKVCLRCQGINCTKCLSVCPELVDPHLSKIPDCTKCGKCIEHCPKQALRMVVLVKTSSEKTQT